MSKPQSMIRGNGKISKERPICKDIEPDTVWPPIDSPGFMEGWYLLEDGCIIFVQISTENGPETDRKYMTPEEYAEFYSDGWIGYLDYTSVYPDMGGDGGLTPYKTDWTIEDVVMDGFGCGVSRYIRMDDPWELRNAVDSGDYGYAEKLISRIPGLRSTFSNMIPESGKK